MGGEREVSKDMPYTGTSMNVNIILVCHSHELRLIISTRVKMGFRGGGSKGVKGERIKKRNKPYHVHAPTPRNDCILPVLQTGNSKKLKSK